MIQTVRRGLSVILVVLMSVLVGCGGAGSDESLIRQAGSDSNIDAIMNESESEEIETGGQTPNPSEPVSDEIGAPGGSQQPLDNRFMSRQLVLSIENTVASWNGVGAERYRILAWHRDAKPSEVFVSALTYELSPEFVSSGGFVLVEAIDVLGNSIFSSIEVVGAP